jgi:hypothetical protein
LLHRGHENLTFPAMSEPKGRRLVLEMFVIVVSVMLALLANEWRQGAARAATVEAVAGTARREAETNRAEVARALEHHRDLLAQLRAGGIITARLDLNRVRLDTTSEARFAVTATNFALAEARAAGRPAPGPFRARRLPDGRWELTSPESRALVEIQGDSAFIRTPGGIVLRPPFLLDSAWEAAQATQASVHMAPEVVAAMAAVRQLQRRVEATADRIIDRLYDAGEADMVSALSDLASFETELLQAYNRLLDLLPSGS